VTYIDGRPGQKKYYERNETEIKYIELGTLGKRTMPPQIKQLISLSEIPALNQQPNN